MYVAVVVILQALGGGGVQGVLITQQVAVIHRYLVALNMECHCLAHPAGRILNGKVLQPAMTALYQYGVAGVGIKAGKAGGMGYAIWVGFATVIGPGNNGIFRALAQQGNMGFPGRYYQFFSINTGFNENNDRLLA